MTINERDEIVDREEAEEEEEREYDPRFKRERIEPEGGVPTEQEWREDRGLGVDPGDELADL